MRIHIRHRQNETQTAVAAAQNVCKTHKKQTVIISKNDVFVSVYGTLKDNFFWLRRNLVWDVHALL